MIRGFFPLPNSMFSTFKIASLAALTSVALLPSCATIVRGGGTQKVAVDSQPSGLEFSVIDAEGKVVRSGKTPETVTLDTGRGYFKSASYTIQVKRGRKVVGEQTITGTTSGWYFGNILIGGIIGSLIVDPLTGAMYKLPETVNVSTKSTASHSQRTLTIASIDTLTSEQRGTLVRL
jgi:hypothetical protein